MAKYIIFNEIGEFQNLAPTESDRDTRMALVTGYHAVEVTDQQYFDAGSELSDPSYENNSITWTTYTCENDMSLSDAEKSQILISNRDFLIERIKEKSGYDSNSDAQAMVSFLENIDTNPSSWWTETQPVVNYIYNISGCPQVFTKEL